MTTLRISLLTLLFLVTAAARADVGGVEVSGSPAFGYSSTDGFSYGVTATVDTAIGSRWQAGLGTELIGYADGSISGIFLGPTYNFSDDLSRAFFLGFGIGYIDHYPNVADSDSGVGYVRFGKRFLLSEKYNVTYKPTVEVRAGNRAAELLLSVLNFSIFLPEN